MIIRTLEVGALRTNCYLVVAEPSRQAVVIDPGGNADVILAALRELEATVRLIPLTHFHFDHIMAAPEVRRATGAPLAIHEAEATLLAQPPALFRFAYPDTPGLTADRLLRDGDELTFGEVTLQVLHTPGHSPGSVCLYCAEENAVFTGDTLFAGDVGRTDLPGGNARQLTASLRRLLTLPAETRVFPGHGPASTLERERRLNPWLRRLAAGPA